MPRSINKVIKVLISSNFTLNSGWGLLAPVFAIFLVQKIAAGNIVEAAEIAGFASLVYWFTKSLLQIPIGRCLDKNREEKDDFWFMVVGIFLASFTPIGYLFSSCAEHIYLMQIVHAIGMAMVVPSKLAIFTRHIDRGEEAFEWGMESTSLGFATGVAGAIGGILVAIFGFSIIFILVGGFTMLSACLLLLIRKEISPRGKVV